MEISERLFLAGKIQSFCAQLRLGETGVKPY